MKQRRLFLVMAAALLTGCAGSPPGFTGLVAPPTGKAVLYIYRTDYFAFALGPWVGPKIRINNYEEISPLILMGYFRVVVEPGLVEVALLRGTWPADQNAYVNLYMDSDTTRFIELSLGKPHFNEILFSFRETTQETAIPALQKLRQLNPN
ncbi:MAG: hypothetical protein ABL892_03995 [Thiobacillaceae bacterium]